MTHMPATAYLTDDEGLAQQDMEHLVEVVRQFAPKLHAAIKDACRVVHSRHTLDRAAWKAFDAAMGALTDELGDHLAAEALVVKDASGFDLSAELRKAMRGAA